MSSAARSTTAIPGVSVVICCHNSAERLPKTLQRLAEQRAEIPWETIVVDNNSTDSTREVAAKCWPAGSPVPFRVEQETEVGLSHARIKGLESARYGFVCFIDDDNRVRANWVALVYEIMSHDPQIGACGGWIHADLESAPPPWWETFQGCFAVGGQWDDPGDLTESKGWLYGAGLTVRKTAWERLRAEGFRFQCADRKGKTLTGGGDIELCYGLKLAGWKLWLDWRLEMDHFIPASRANWPYVRRLFHGAGLGSIYLGMYGTDERRGRLGRLKEHWLWQTLATVKRMVVRWKDVWAYYTSGREGDERVLWVEGQLGRLREFLSARGKIAEAAEAVRRGNWRKAVR